LRDSQLTEQIRAVLSGDFAQVASGQLGPFDVGQGIDVELKLGEMEFNAFCDSGTGGRCLTKKKL
jgi:hypothetical protein